MEYLKELMVLGYSLMVFAALMYLWHNYLSPWREPNKELLRNANEWQRKQLMKELDSRSDEEKERFYEEMRGMVQHDFKQMIEEEENHFWSNPPGNYEDHE